MPFDAIRFLGKTRHFVELAKAGEQTAFLTIADNLKPMATQEFNAIKFGHSGSVQVNHLSRSVAEPRGQWPQVCAGWRLRRLVKR